MEIENETITRLADSYERLPRDTFDPSPVKKPFWLLWFEKFDNFMFGVKTEEIFIGSQLQNQINFIPDHLNGVHLHIESERPKLTEVRADADLFDKSY